MSLSNEAIANLIDKTVRDVMTEHVLPRVEQEVESRMESTVYRAILNLGPDVVRQEVRQAVRDIFMSRVKAGIKITFEDVEEGT